MDLRFPRELATNQIDGAIRLDQRLGQAEHIDQDRAVQPGPRRVFINLIEGQESLITQQVKLSPGLSMLRVGEGARVEGRDVGILCNMVLSTTFAKNERDNARLLIPGQLRLLAARVCDLDQ